MPNNNFNKRSNRSRNTKRPAKNLDVLRQINTTMQALTLHQLPMVKDVQQMRMSRNRVFSATLEADYFTIVSPASGTTFGGFAAILANFGGYADYTACFDQYRILQVKCSFLPILLPASANAPGVILYTCFDYDDSSSPSAVSDLEQYDTCQIVQAGTYFERIFNPRIAMAASASGAFTSYANMKANWIDSASAAVGHYGIKYAITTNPSTSSQQAWYLKMSIFVQFRSQR